VSTRHGWEALQAHFDRLFPNAPRQGFGTVRRYAEGGPDPLDHVAAYDRDAFWHFVTFGFSELAEKENDNPDVSGFGFELSFRLRKVGESKSPPTWAVVFLQTLARYVFRNSAPFEHAHYINWGGAITDKVPTELSALAFADDPELGTVPTPNGRVAFLAVIPVVASDYARIAERDEPELLTAALSRDHHLYITDTGRRSLLQ
jgi:suppressor of fused-like protein